MTGGHTFAHAGPQAARSRSPALGGGTTTATWPRTVANAPITTTGRDHRGHGRDSVTGVLAGDVPRLPTPLATADDFTAVIAWGDGATSAGTIAASGTGSFNVTGDHSYAQFGTKTARTCGDLRAGERPVDAAPSTVDMRPTRHWPA